MKLVVHNTNKFNKILIEKTVNYSVSMLNLDRLKELNIKVVCSKHYDTHGWVTQEEKRDFTIGMASNYNSIREFVATLAHEMEHIRQYIRKCFYSDEMAEDEADYWGDRIANDMWEKNLI